MSRATPRSLIATLATGLLLAAIFSALVIWFRRDLRAEIHLKIIERDAAVLYPMALQQIAESEAGGPGSPSVSVTALLRSARQRGMLAVAVFDREGNTIEAVPANQLFVELPTEDFLLLQAGRPISGIIPPSRSTSILPESPATREWHPSSRCCCRYRMATRQRCGGLCATTSTRDRFRASSP
jgi:hypothetical protein